MTVETNKKIDKTIKTIDCFFIVYSYIILWISTKCQMVIFTWDYFCTIISLLVAF
nr:MAG TPA: hypothetical protein [Caudoviricetes sp.]